ncbi:MAG: PKD domain-containing protein [Candidatus Micrarchaeota archaeon]
MRLLLVLAFVSLSFAASHDGDGTYKLFEGDSVRSDNGFDVSLSGLDTGFDQNQNPVVESASYVILRSGEEVADPTLEEDESYTASVQDGKRNVTIKVLGLGYELDANQQLQPYARTRVSSSTYVPESLRIASVNVSPGEYGVNVYWTTNLAANGTIYLYGTSFLAPLKVASDTSSVTAHSLSFSDLTSDTEYTVSIESCDSVCVSEERTFRTSPAIPVISGVKATAITNDSARITWRTDIVSDSMVYYRKLGATTWERAPPPGKYDAITIERYYVPPEIETGFNVSGSGTAGSGSDVAGTAPPANAVQFSPATAVLASFAPVAGGYTIKSGMISGITDPSLLELIVKKNHSVNLFGLQPETTYEYLVSSCADRCANSTISRFNTTKTLYDPYAGLFPYSPSISHGSSLILTISAYSRNPGGALTETELQWDDESTTKSMTPYFGGDNRSFLPSLYSALSVVSITFTDPGAHTLTLRVKDNFGRVATATTEITVSERTACKEAKYYPPDTTCTDKWPYDGQATVDYNQEIGACHAFEVCDDSIDYMIADAESCCNGQYEFSDLPEQTSYGYDKKKNCDIALADTRMKKPMTHLNAASSMKVCKTSYLVHGIGSSAIYMKDYYRGEACCKDNPACGDNPRFEAGPWPASNIKFSELRCVYTLVKPLIGSNYKVPKDGWYGSDSDPKANNNAMLTTPTHSSINVMNTGTCVDYSLAVTTALRKAGYKKNEVPSMEAPGHMYNLVYLPGESKYSLVDTVGNRGGEFFTGGGWGWKYKGVDTDHCSYKADRCGNDLGFWTCPGKGEVTGC